MLTAGDANVKGECADDLVTLSPGASHFDPPSAIRTQDG